MINFELRTRFAAKGATGAKEKQKRKGTLMPTGKLTTMKAAVLREPRTPLVVEEIARPVPANDEVIIQVEACGVCHSDLHVADGDWMQFAGITKNPLVLGHEIAANCIETR